MQRECCLASGRRARVPRDALGMRGTARTSSPLPQTLTLTPTGRRAVGRSAVYHPLCAAMLGHPAAYALPCSATPQLAPPAGACVRCTWVGSRGARGAPPEGHATVPLTCVQPRSAGALPQPPLLPPPPLPPGARPHVWVHQRTVRGVVEAKGYSPSRPRPRSPLRLSNVFFCH